jgi:hypothetical protein
MATIKDQAQDYKSEARISNIADLQIVQINAEIKEELNVEFPYSYIQIENTRYKVPKSVLQSLKSILEENPNLQKFKVKKTGEGMDTKYIVIPMA